MFSEGCENSPVVEGLRDQRWLYNTQILGVLDASRVIRFFRQHGLQDGLEKFVNGILPLSIHPAPAQIARVFVGRLELVTPATEKAVEAAFAAHDKAEPPDE